MNTSIESIYRVFVPTGLIVLMFGMGLQLVKDDWLRLGQYPLAVLAGLLGQFVLLPAIAFLLIYVLSLPTAVSAGLIILAACPGGVVSNSISFLARADIALSVTLTAISSLLALITIPLIVGFGLAIIDRGLPESANTVSIQIPLAATIKQLMIVVLLPLTAGMLVRRFAEGFARHSEPWFRAGNVLVLVILMVGAIGMQFDFFKQNFQALWPVLLTLNLTTMLGGYLLARLMLLGRIQRRTIAIEVGVQNVALGVLVALNILQRPEWIVVPSVYSIVMLLTSFVLIAMVNFGLKQHDTAAAP